RFMAAIKIFKILGDQKVMYLLHFIGSATPADSYTATFNTLTSNLAEFYAPKPLEIAENFRVYQCKQQEDESLKDVMAALQKLSVQCNFKGYLKTALRNQLIFELVSRRAQSQLLKTRVQQSGVQTRRKPTTKTTKARNNAVLSNTNNIDTHHNHGKSITNVSYFRCECKFYGLHLIESVLQK
ncbi:hypothetical protein ALC56_01286, partial [Trachymyrmex septentrionalis]